MDTKVLNDKAPLQKKITLSSLIKLSPSKVNYDGLLEKLS